ncbi:poly-beta-1,6-N-acetyl-D-glucosamine N-deacetylase PgaB [Methylogaea oryzae]|uniref:Poly-beta-1,6-N-acetyl-D-glucosamine N-deacetylase PgaB n=2 Tax=Methylogaea oryzae TaxID=1295382 RepID=A0A8D4VPW0_9GAMM|nr:poly-beta-1,6-N-acetyl-D-glucosamine N-deacetylase PgaB [Methylogaea oryzae]BBL71868.1 poly-beta-1,6-N-acetyl-D-glucosamine N-deacetylase PgaB [Methylogaea oryzae]
MLRTLACLFCLALTAGAVQAAEPTFLAINYHDIIDEEERVPPFDRVAVSRDHFESHFAWLKQQGYRVVSVQDVLDAADGKRSLPAKAVLLTFDDGYQSFYTKVFPLLKKYNYPATVALIGTWMDRSVKPDMPGDKQILTWEQARELARSGLVEIASHSYGLHQGIPANPQGNEQGAAVARRYNKETGRYEDDEAYRKRIHDAMEQSADFIFQNVGVRPRVMVWPYGEYNEITLEAAKEAGMPITMGLKDGANTLADLRAMKRLLIADDPNREQFAGIVTGLRAALPQRVAHVDMDYIHDPDPAQTERNLGALIERIRDMGISTVYLQAYSDPDGDGNAEQLYFPNRHLPVRQDLFNRVAWQLKTRAGVKVYAWMPMMAYKAKLPDDWYVKEWRDGKAQTAGHIYTRLSPFNPEARRWVGELYEDLAKHCAFDGILFHDDGILSDFEDASPQALAYTRDVWGLPGDFAALHATPKMRLAWAQRKTGLMIEFTDYLADKVRLYRPYIKTARNFYTLPLLQPESEEWYAQSFPAFLKGYDYVAVEAMPFMEKAADPDRWLAEVVKRAAAHKDGLSKTVFELQSMDWNTQKPVPMETFNRQVDMLRKLGAVHIGYYPDNAHNDQPRLSDLQQHFALPR